MVNEIIERAKAEIIAEKDFKVREECAKLEQEIIMPKFAEFDRERETAVALEKERHADHIKRIGENYEKNKAEFSAKVKGSVEGIVENKYHYSDKINGLDKLIGE